MFKLIRTSYLSLHSIRRVPTITSRMASSSSTSRSSPPNSTTSDPLDPLSLSQKATQLVYGPLPVVVDQSAYAYANWNPPSSPGAGGHLGRYLWTDAFGLLNLITLSRELSNPGYLTLARNLVRSVHQTLGRTRDQKSLLPLATDSSPLKGGLRIGKMDECGSDGDGQYHHYLTIWMFALNRLSLATGEKEWNRMAIELAGGIHPYFVFRRENGTKRMVWKVSMDLKKVLVPSEGHLDAATGYVVYSLLKRTAEGFGEENTGRLLDDEINDYKEIMAGEGKLSVSADPLDLGMGLWMCHFFCGEEGWARKMGEESLDVARKLLDEKGPLMKRDAARRLAFREFGSCLGLRCYGMAGDDELEGKVRGVLKFWERYLDGETEDLEDLRPISLVMFASALIPGAFRDGYLEPVQV
ncbi:hypothetical protein QBC37DRAFT_414911 [Rhypophila decipiens]|uniref:Uncharacterized protein n=1 Tax=Rhypophila decipiens TaxID=261697 RepID=A0AAN6YIL3_9PEZI|nr:hypothetical protein QBC37DRAFT_414911 [Rhypophila decipiens]